MQATSPTLAVVIVNYNYAPYVGRAVESALEQEERFDEVVVVDDGSTDDSLEVVRAFEPRVRVVAKENGGQLSACRAGLEAVSADYVLFLDSDDMVSADLVARVRPHLVEAPVKVQFQLRAVDAQGQPTGSVFPTFPKNYPSEAMRQDVAEAGGYTTPPTSGNVYRRSTLLALNWSVLDLRDFIDGPATLVLPFLGDIVSINEPFALYRVHGANHSQWYAPTPELLEHEIDWFRERWVQACGLLGWQRPPFDPEQPLYVAERRLMSRALSGRAPSVLQSVRVVRQVRRCHQTTTQRVVFSVWAVLLMVPSRRLRRQLVMERRSHASRGPLMRAVVRVVRLVR